MLCWRTAAAARVGGGSESYFLVISGVQNTVAAAGIFPLMQPGVARVAGGVRIQVVAVSAAISSGKSIEMRSF